MPESNVERTLGVILGNVEDIKRRMDHADESRSEIHQGINGLVLRVSHIEKDVLSLKMKVEGVEDVTDDVKNMSLRAQAQARQASGRLRLGWVSSARSDGPSGPIRG